MSLLPVRLGLETAGVLCVATFCQTLTVLPAKGRRPQKEVQQKVQLVCLLAGSVPAQRTSQ